MEDIKKLEEVSVKNGDKRPKRGANGRFVEGNPGGPGRPAGLSITDKIREVLQEVPEGQKMSYLDAFVRQILKKAIIDGDGPTQKLLWNYIDGMPRARFDLGADRESLSELTRFFQDLANAG